jgi:hypothetical protein
MSENRLYVIYALVQRRRRSLVGWALAVPAVADRLCMFFLPSSPRLVLVGSISWLLFFSYVTWSQLRSLLKQREVTGETISMSISVYLLPGLTWGLLYIVIFARHPEAFSFGTSPRVSEEQMFPIFIYFSLAATRLGMNRSTLQFRMKKLGILRPAM